MRRIGSLHPSIILNDPRQLQQLRTDLEPGPCGGFHIDFEAHPVLLQIEIDHLSSIAGPQARVVVTGVPGLEAAPLALTSPLLRTLSYACQRSPRSTTASICRSPYAFVCTSAAVPGEPKKNPMYNLNTWGLFTSTSQVSLRTGCRPRNYRSRRRFLLPISRC